MQWWIPRVYPAAEKDDRAGTQSWLEQFGTVADDAIYSLSSSDSAVYAGGRTCDTIPGQTGSGGCDAFVRKYDRDGAEVWTIQFGSSRDDVASAVTVAAGGVIAAGLANGALSDSGGADVPDLYVRQLSEAVRR